MRLYKRLSFGLSVRPHIALNVIISTVCGRIDLKFGGDLQVDLHLLFHFLFLLSSSSSSPFSLEFKVIHIYKAKQHVGNG
jgi:hypothetical protein